MLFTQVHPSQQLVQKIGKFCLPILNNYLRTINFQNQIKNYIFTSQMVQVRQNIQSASPFLLDAINKLNYKWNLIISDFSKQIFNNLIFVFHFVDLSWALLYLLSHILILFYTSPIFSVNILMCIFHFLLILRWESQCIIRLSIGNSDLSQGFHIELQYKSSSRFILVFLVQYNDLSQELSLFGITLELVLNMFIKMSAFYGIKFKQLHHSIDCNNKIFMNSYINRINPKTNTTLQIVFLASAGVWLIILLFSNYQFSKQEYYGEQLECKLKYDGYKRCRLNNKLLYKERINSSDCQDQYVCNTILAAYPITIIDLVLIVIALTMCLLKQSNLPGNTINFNYISIISVAVSGLTLIVLSIILMSAINNYDLQAWVIVSQFFVSLILFASLIFIRREEQLSSEILKQEQLNNVEIKQYVVY
ncbi:unnamed protein product (macronuclear) [Paramecium tetraurelia]|uniref:Transmembrane protein n=1 Tax=Paramecium tetraurelia TaxID=5888 RepID=A0BZ30_PARTE|nr:uncharacterized protein GSPATT00033650001 [Paramecium tetraurelia]CAK63797.1 unnamed protein product [Paramecium tetraurelia]|eukprot:XP_001431195.1 hypothetical protein (macronuclear) [Paramecium tetraurelia strain d4-2]